MNIKLKPTPSSSKGYTLVEIVIAGIFLLVILGVVSAPFVGVIKTNQTVHILREYCKMDVGFWQVAINGDQLTRICAAQNRKIELELSGR